MESIPQIDTSAFSQNLTVKTPSFTQPDIPIGTQPVDLNQAVSEMPDTSIMVDMMRKDALMSQLNMSNGGGTMEKILNKKDNSIHITGSKIDIDSSHERLNSGDWIPKYDSYLSGVDNETRLSRNQSGWDKFTNTLLRFGSNTSKGVLDIGSFVYGVGEAALSGRFDALYDNSMSRYVDDLTTKTNFKYKNYYDEETRKKGLGLDIQTLDKVFGGAEFTARMLASEGLIALATSGVSLPSSMAKIGLKGLSAVDKISDASKITQIGKKISNMMRVSTLPERTIAEIGGTSRMYDRLNKGLNIAAKRGALGDKLVMGRFALTSPMYEAGFEAMHFRKEAEKDFLNYFKNKGIEPTPEQINSFSEKMGSASDAVFIANMGILSVSNLVLFGDILNVKNPLAKSVFSPSKFIKESVFKQGTEKITSTGLNQAMKAGIWNKAAAYLSPVLKGMAVEGVYEEGSQGIASNTLKNYVASAYDEKAMKLTSDYVNSFGKAFQDQWGTKSGQEEMIIGAIIGGLFGGAGGIGIPFVKEGSVTREYKNQKNIADLQNTGEEFIENYRSNAYTNEQLLSLFSGSNRIQTLRSQLLDAESSNDKLQEASLKAQSFITLLDSYHTVGKDSQFVEMFTSMLKGMDNQIIADQTGLDVSEADSFKQEQIKNIEEFADKYSTARKAAQYIFKPNISGFTEVDGKKINASDMSSAFAFSSTMTFFNEKFAFETFDAFQNKLSQLNANDDLIREIGTIASIKGASEIEKNKYTELSKETNKLRLELGKVTKQINTLNQGEEKTSNSQKRLELSDKLIKVQEELRNASLKEEALLKSMVENFYSKMNKKGIPSQIDLNNFTEKVQDIQSSLDNLNVSEEDKIILESLLEQFNTSHNAYKDFADLTTKLSDPKFSFKTYSSIIGGLRARKDKSLNEHTKDVLLKIYGYNSEMRDELNRTYSENKKEVFTDEKLTTEYVPTEEDFQLIKDRIDNRKTLSENEEKFYKNHKDEIDSIESDPLNSQSNKTNINEISVEINSLQNELDNLNEGIYTDEFQEKLDSKTDLIEKIQEIESEIFRIENELAVLNGELTLEEKANRIQNIIKNLKSRIISEDNSNINNIQRLIVLERALKELQDSKLKSEFNPESTPVEQLEWIVNNIPDLGYSTVEDLSTLSPPSQEDVDEYRNLLKITNKNSSHKKRIAELRDKLLPYNLAEGLDLDGTNIVDIINLYNQSKKIQEIQETQNEKQSEESFQEIVKATQESADRNKYDTPKVTLNYDGTYIEMDSGINKIYHIKLFTFLNKALEKGLSPEIIILDEKGLNPIEKIEVNTENIDEVSEFFDNKDNIKINLDIENGLYLKKPLGSKSFHVYGEGILNLIDSEAYYITGQSTGYIAIFDEKSDNSFAYKESEFNVTSDGKIIPFDKKVTNSLKPGDTVTLEFDKNDDYNKSLSVKEYNSKGNIYVKKNGKLVQILKAIPDKTSKNEGWDKLLALRKKVIKSKTPLTVKIENSYLGLPIITLNSDKTVKEIPVNSKKVIAYGYIDEKGELQGDVSKVKKIDNTQYIEPLKKIGKITPIMAFKAYGKVILFPVNLKEKGLNLSQNVEDIMNSEKTMGQKIFELNVLLEENGLFNTELAQDFSNLDTVKVKNALSNITSKIDVTDSKQFEEADKYTYINLDDPFMSSKLVLDLGNSTSEIKEVEKVIKETVKKNISTVNNKGKTEANKNEC